MAAPFYSAYKSGGAYSNANTITCNLPAGMAIGELVMIMVICDDASGVESFDNNTNKPTGFTLAQVAGSAITQLRTALFYKYVDGTEGATVACGVGSLAYCLYFSVYVTGARQSDPFILGAPYDSQADLLVHQYADVTTTEIDCLGFAFGGSDGTDCTPFSIANWAERANTSFTAGSPDATALYFATLAMPTISTYTGPEVTIASSDGFAGMAFAVKPISSLCEVRETFLDNVGVPYADTTVVYCYADNGNLAAIGAVGAKTGAPVGSAAVGAGEAVFSFAQEVGKQYFMVVGPSIDAYGIVTNLLTPVNW